MIESEEKRKALRRIIVSWAGHVKVLPLLREHDIPDLVSCIIDEFYRVTLCCGHKVKDCNEGVAIAFEDVDDAGEQVTKQGLYCKECAEEHIRKLGAWTISE